MATGTVLLFDVDGTLITTGGAGKRAIDKALAATGHAAATHFSFAGMTDRAIIRKALQGTMTSKTTGPAMEATIDTILEAYLALLPKELESSHANTYVVHPGVEPLLQWVHKQPAVACGLGTGNVEAGARAKLRPAALNRYFAFGGFGCDHELRPELIRAGAHKGAAELNVSPEACRVVVIGDTPKDIAAARAIGADCVAVATGSYSRKALASHDPTFVFDDLSDDAVRSALLRAV